MKIKVEKANCGASVKAHKGFNMGGGYQSVTNTSRLSKDQDREQKLKKLGLSTGAMVERREKADAKKAAAAKAESMKKGAQKGSKAKTVQSVKKKDEIKAYGGSQMMGKKFNPIKFCKKANLIPTKEKYLQMMRVFKIIVIVSIIIVLLSF